jgi:flagellum-specific ATP synthase
VSALARLARDIAREAEGGLAQAGGEIVSVGAGALGVAGLSPLVALGDLVRFEGAEAGSPDGFGEVVRIDPQEALVKPFAREGGAALGARCWRVGPHRLAPDLSWKGRVVDAFGRPVDGGPPLIPGPLRRPTAGDPPAPLGRARVGGRLATGVRALDIFTPMVAGQRLGVFAGSGVGKSTLLSMLARAADFDAVVVALVGERGREAREFLEESLAASRDRAVVVLATADESAMMRRLAPRTAMTIAETFRDAGQSVLLIVDSITRYAHALREAALAAGEPPVARGYPPSVFSDLPRLLERAGPGPDGSGGAITGVFAVLVDGDDHDEPVADAIRGTLDGHVVLSRAVADEGRFPAVDLLRSISRLAPRAWSADERKLARQLKALIARYEDTRDLRLMGGYARGVDLELDRAVALAPRIYAFCTQTPEDPPSRQPFAELAEALRGDVASDSRKPAA